MVKRMMAMPKLPVRSLSASKPLCRPPDEIVIPKSAEKFHWDRFLFLNQRALTLPSSCRAAKRRARAIHRFRVGFAPPH